MRFLSIAMLASASALTLNPRPAAACGGCFHGPPQVNETESVITDHRMALAISPTQTTLWDQVKYSGDPAEFAWVLPVGKGATIELARDEWLEALDVMSAPVVTSPAVSCPGGFGGGGYGGGGGCGGGDSSGVSYEGDYDSGVSDSSFSGGGGVDVVGQEVVGPYLAVTIHASEGEAIAAWLTANGFVIPDAITPVLDAYTATGLDFLALKLRPNQGIRAMRPVRVTTPGGSPTLPLRMVAAGVGSSVGLTLFVISEGRYAPANFPSTTIAQSSILWNPYAKESNYAELFATASAGGTWVTESSLHVPALQASYMAACMSAPPITEGCAADAGASDASTSDAGDDAAADDAATDDAAIDAAMVDDASIDALDESDPGDAGAEASTDEGGTTQTDAGCTQTVAACSEFTDYAAATVGIVGSPVITRLRTDLPATALDKDLILGSTSQNTFGPTFLAAGYTDAQYNPCPATPPPSAYDGSGGCYCDAGTARSTNATTFALGVLGVVVMMRRRRR